MTPTEINFIISQFITIYFTLITNVGITYFVIILFRRIANL